MNIIETDIEGVLIFEPRLFHDDRGHFYESYRLGNFTDKDPSFNFIQENQSTSKKGVIRGLHFQNPPFAQAKLVRAVSGVIKDVAVDIRKNSKTYGHIVSCILSAENRNQILIPAGFAHGFSVLSEEATVIYKISSYYNKEAESSIHPFSEDLNIDWEVKAEEAILSGKDKESISFKNFQTQF